MTDLDASSPAKHFNVLIEVLPVQVHQVRSLVLLQAAVQTACVVLLCLSDLVVVLTFFASIFTFRILRVRGRPLDKRQLHGLSSFGGR